jgi:uncharacterized protein (TIGR01244 family)
MKIEHFYDERTNTFTYIVIDETTKKCAVIDSVMDYDQFSGNVSTESADKIIDYIKNNNLDNQWIIETHIHADHVSAAYYLKDKIGGKTGIGEQISEVLKFWVGIFENEIDTPLTGEQFDVLFKDKQEFNIGNLKAKVIHTPGHTPACVSYVIEDCVFVGDTIFSPKMGTARCDFPGGSSAKLFDSIQKLYQLPDSTNIYLCHDYPEKHEQPRFLVSVKEQKETNSMVNQNIKKEDFVELRDTKDFGKDVPKLIIPSIQTNLRTGSFGATSPKGVQFIKVPINMLGRDIGKFKKITSNYYVSSQIDKADINQAKEAGFKSIFCLRPDMEDQGQLSAMEIKKYANDLGLVFYHIPVVMANLPAEQIKEFSDFYKSAPKPILSYCRSGNRALTLWKTMKGK